MPADLEEVARGVVPKVGLSAGWLETTNVPLPVRETVSPMACRARSASRSTGRLTSKSRHRSASEGSLSPTAYSPRSMASAEVGEDRFHRTDALKLSGCPAV